MKIYKKDENGSPIARTETDISQLPIGCDRDYNIYPGNDCQLVFDFLRHKLLLFHIDYESGFFGDITYENVTDKFIIKYDKDI